MTKAEFNEKQPKIVYGLLGDTYVFTNEVEKQVEENTGIMNENGDPVGESVLVTKYEYDVYTVDNKCQTEEEVLAALKTKRVQELADYDEGRYVQYGNAAVNDFTISGTHMWLDKTTRNGLDYRFKCEQALGKTETTLWYGTLPITLPIETATLMLAQLEVYASECFDRTAAHHQAIEQLSDIDDVINYDFKTDYPAKLSF